MEIAAATEQIVEPLLELARGEGVRAEGLVRHGQPAEVLLSLAHDQSAEFIVVGRTGDSGLKDRIFGSVSSRIAQHASVPVTVVP